MPGVSATAHLYADIDIEPHARLSTGIGEFDRVLGGGRHGRVGTADGDERGDGGQRILPDPVRQRCEPDGLRAGRYKFGDFWRLGLVVLIWTLIVTVIVTPVYWPFH